MNDKQRRAYFAQKYGTNTKKFFDSEGKEIPNEHFYVTLTDKFLSGWGKAEGKKNRLIIPTRSLREAELVKQEANTRNDFTNIEVKERIPNYDHRKNFVQVKTREDMPKLFKKVYFDETGKHWRP